ISWWLQYTSLFVIVSFCPWCFASALTVTAICAVNAYDYLVLGRVLTGEQKMLSGMLAFIGVMVAFIYAPQILFQWHRATDPPGKERTTHPPVPPGPQNRPFEHPREELLSKGLHFKGKPTASYTIIEFADYACSHCAKASEEMNALMQKYPDRYRLAFRNYPLGKWRSSRAEAAAAEAAGKHGKFWEMHDILFAHQSEAENPEFDPAKILEWGRSIGLDVTQLKKEMGSGTMIAQVQEDYRIGWKNRITMTPTFFVVPTDPKGKVMMIIGDADLNPVLNNPQDPFWRGDLSSLKDPETAGND
ncbi:MAG: Protein-disulfide isomerase, partial [Chthonomonadales bacterium]|nr:Protein-disulfide isomerase [Chthonomonadales bacterium]